MCRFIAYLGTPIILYNLLYKPTHSLIKQSSHAREMDEPLNGDGFGVSWYMPEIDNFPGIFKSIQPAWNNINLEMLSKKIQSGCFLAHVRAATKASISYFNTHPFHYEEYSFMHNGIIEEIERIKRSIQCGLSEEIYHWVRGQTDSELLFALVLEALRKRNESLTIKNSIAIFKESIDSILDLKEKLNLSNSANIVNCVFTDGRQLFVFRYASPATVKPNSLYYSEGHHIEYKDGYSYLVPSPKDKKAVLIVSEILNRKKTGWAEVPANHMLAVDQKLNTSFHPL